MAKMVKKSPAPLYFAAAVWLGWGLLLPLYRLSDYLIAAAASILAGLLGKKLFPDTAYETPEAEKKQEPQKPESTGDPEIDALIAERERAVSEMRRLNANISGEKISAQIDHLEEATRKIISYVVEHPEKLPQIRRFMDYYLPITLKLLRAYDQMSNTGVSGENINKSLAQIETMMRSAAIAFSKQLDGLYGNDALDISAEIAAMETMLAKEGLTGQELKAGPVQTDSTDIRLEL